MIESLKKSEFSRWQLVGCKNGMDLRSMTNDFSKLAKIALTMNTKRRQICWLTPLIQPILATNLTMSSPTLSRIKETRVFQKVPQNDPNQLIPVLCNLKCRVPIWEVSPKKDLLPKKTTCLTFCHLQLKVFQILNLLLPARVIFSEISWLRLVSSKWVLRWEISPIMGELRRKMIHNFRHNNNSRKWLILWAKTTQFLKIRKVKLTHFKSYSLTKKTN